MKKHKSILEAVRETAEGLHEAGAMSDLTMREFDALCLPPVKELSAAQIKRIRIKNKASQPVFAAFLNTTPSTVKQWEQGDKKPSGLSMKLLNIVADKGIQVLV